MWYINVRTLGGHKCIRQKRLTGQQILLLLVPTEYLKKELAELHRNNVIIRAIGLIQDLPQEAQRELKNSIAKTRNNTGLILNLALNYGGRAEIIEAVKAISRKVSAGELRVDEINEEQFNQVLYTRDLPDPDLLIRTSGEMRLSNFLLWQLAYTEIVITKELWPDFRKETLFDAIIAYQKRDRRYGGIHTN